MRGIRSMVAMCVGLLAACACVLGCSGDAYGCPPQQLVQQQQLVYAQPVVQQVVSPFYVQPIVQQVNVQRQVVAHPRAQVQRQVIRQRIVVR